MDAEVNILPSAENAELSKVLSVKFGVGQNVALLRSLPEESRTIKCSVCQVWSRSECSLASFAARRIQNDQIFCLSSLE